MRISIDTAYAAAHPRSRGENPDCARSSSAAWGSSPLTRGKPVYHMTGGTEARLIPAHAGKTHLATGPLPYSGGLIPAHAGKTSSVVTFWLFATAHPRSRGENVSILGPNVASNGSSPLTRGKRAGLPPLISTPRLIPAHAGKTAPCPLRA